MSCCNSTVPIKTQQLSSTRQISQSIESQFINKFNQSRLQKQSTMFLFFKLISLIQRSFKTTLITVRKVNNKLFLNLLAVIWFQSYFSDYQFTLAIQLTRDMDSSTNILPSLSHKVISDNPQIEQQRCRICYEEAKPLITLCQCSGSIAFVHEDCILDWITKKMESAEVVEIPRCEICRTTYSAKLKIGRKKICPKLLYGKLKELKLIQFITTFFYILGSVLAIITASTAVFMFGSFVMTPSAPATDEKGQSQSVYGYLLSIFINMVFPLMFLKAAINHGKKRMKLIQESKVQIVQVTLNPKMVIKI